KIEKTLLKEFHGDLALALAWTSLTISDIGTQVFSSNASRLLKEGIASRRRLRFSTIAFSDWDGLFSPQGKVGNRYCVICQTPLAKGEGTELPGQDNIPMEARGRSCNTCHSFGELAKALGNAEFLSIGSRKPQKSEKWQDILFEVGNHWFSLKKEQEITYTLNNADFLHKSAQGFRFIANVTPHVTKEDIDNPDVEEDEEKAELGDVRTFSQIASSALGIKNIGVLRMDVDNLGMVMIKGLEPRTMVATSALSSAFDLFFSGYLNNMCQEIEKEREESLYIIYSGGDDLFIIGAWDLMTPLAEKIRTDFAQYTGNNPSLTISGAVTLEGKKFPLYQAAERAGEAEDKAKGYKRDNMEKNAFHFLGMNVGWEEWEKVKGFRRDMEIALNAGAPKALLQIMQNLYAQYSEQMKSHKAQFGPWEWRGVYALSRMTARIQNNNDAREAIRRLKSISLHPSQIHFAGLAARWVELLNRKEN
ncbi:MAG: type III-A CRISPR-associated protein Cas10/Csm1, partial [Anaerolineae bacterium]|nr:type III-A CRISPR-associated protein Cas10/Csm1 [Anaerolineae bacterium]